MASIQGVKVTGIVVPSDTLDTYAVIDPIYGIDGLRNLAGGTSDLSLITTDRRRAGMLVGINNGASYYKLNPAPWTNTLSDWTPFTVGGGGTFSGGTVTGSTTFTNGITTNTISATTIYTNGLTADTISATTIYAGTISATTYLNLPINLQKTIASDYEINNLDNNHTIMINNTSTPITITIPSGLLSKISVGFIQQGSADVTIAAAGGSNVTIRTPISGAYKIKGINYNAYIEQVNSSNIYQLLGNLKA